MIPRPDGWRRGPAPYWLAAGYPDVKTITVEQVRSALEHRGEPPPFVVPPALLPEPRAPRRPSAVLCALFEEDGQAHVVLTRRSSELRSHTHQVAFPGGRIDEGEAPLQAALREAWEEVRLDTTGIEIVGQLAQLHTGLNPMPITPFVGVVPGRPEMVPNPSEVERAFTTPLVELVQPGVYHQEIWPFARGEERAVHFFDLIGDTAWGATAQMLIELLSLVVPPEG